MSHIRCCQMRKSELTMIGLDMTPVQGLHRTTPLAVEEGFIIVDFMDTALILMPTPSFKLSLATVDLLLDLECIFSDALSGPDPAGVVVSNMLREMMDQPWA
mmetsp:Transcript_21018/g.32944  ORF Transcript_21018/g.32944 Transcript_21018/m.32944 type:complete len:102 (+) Transcript_21018:314-619(+)